MAYEIANNGSTSETTTYSYDLNGNLTAKSKGVSTTNYTYNVWGNMISGAGATYGYNSQNLRTSKTVGNETDNFVLIAGNVWSDGDADYFRGIELISNGTQLYLYNIRGDVIQLVGFDGEVDKTYDYDAYGNELQRDLNDSNPFRYCGEYYDEETGFIYLRARYYDPMVGRFTSVDPIKDGLNWYAYCSGNPIAFVDPTGLCGECVNSGVRDGWYVSADEAAYQFGQEYGKEKNEYSAIIYSRVVYKYNGKNYSLMQIMELGLEGIIASTSDFFKTATKTKEYTYGTVVKGDLNNVKPKYETGFGKIEAVVHTHGRFSLSDEDLNISSKDIDFAEDIFNYGIKYATTYNEEDKVAYKNPAKGIKDIWIYMYLFVGDGKYSYYDTTEVLKKYQPMTEETIEINVNVFSGVIEAY